jgi:hypothetical protein
MTACFPKWSHTVTNNIKVEIYGADEHPFGKTWQEWTVQWWRWFLSIPREGHPSYDSAYKRWANNQPDPNVLFLAATTKGKIERKIVIPSNKAILFPVINFVTSYSEDPALKTEAEMIAKAKSNIDDIVKKEAVIDGIALSLSENNRVQTPPFDFYFPTNNIYRAKEGPSRGVGDGFWIFLRPLRPGKHNIRTYGSCLSGRIEIEANIELIVKS